MGTVQQPKHVDFSSIILVAVIGGLLSITLHELLHIVLHWGEITGIRILPNFYTLAEVIIDIPDHYDLAGEEFLAYLVSAAVLLATAATITRMYDRADTRSVQQILFPHRLQTNTLPAKQASKKLPTQHSKKS